MTKDKWLYPSQKRVTQQLEERFPDSTIQTQWQVISENRVVEAVSVDNEYLYMCVFTPYTTQVLSCDIISAFKPE